MRTISIAIGALLCLIEPNASCSVGQQDASSSAQPGTLKSEFIFAAGRVPFAQCHAPTIAETRESLLAAWFGGSGEGHLDVGIWLSRLDNGVWALPREVATGKKADGSREPCWNPVLFQPKAGPLFLFYKVGPSPR